MNKKLLCLLLALTMCVGLASPVFAAGEAATAAADRLYSLGLFRGVGINDDGSPDYALDRAPTREEAVTLLVRLLGKESEAQAGTWDIPFTDVANWAKPYVGYAYANGLTTGTSETTFSGSDSVSATQFLTFVLRAMGYSSGSDYFWDSAWTMTDALGITSGEYGVDTIGEYTTDSFTRGDAVIVLANALNIAVKDDSGTLLETITQAHSEADEIMAPDEPATPATVDPNIPVVNEYGIYSRGALLVELETGATVFAYNENEIFYPASLVKMMTAILAIEMIPDLDKEITITYDMLDGLYEAGASQVGFVEGEKVRAIDLLYGVMLPSGADAANAVAVAAAGSIAEFVSLMNSKAVALGLYNTHFVNVHGLHDEKQVSTATDLAALLSYCLKNETFRELFTTMVYTIPATNLHPDGIAVQNNLMKALDSSDLEGKEYVLGSKNGFTTPAGQCLASLGRVNGREYILITLNAGLNGYNYERYNMLDAVYLYNTLK